MAKPSAGGRPPRSRLVDIAKVLVRGRSAARREAPIAKDASLLGRPGGRGTGPDRAHERIAPGAGHVADDPAFTAVPVRGGRDGHEMSGPGSARRHPGVRIDIGPAAAQCLPDEIVHGRVGPAWLALDGEDRDDLGYVALSAGHDASEEVGGPVEAGPRAQVAR